MYSASRQTCVDPLQHSANILFASLNSLLRGVDGRVVLLRPLPQQFDDQCDDVDVLMTNTQREQFLRAAFHRCVQQEVHCRIQQSSPAKTRLTLWTTDASQSLMIDVWTDFDQLPLHRHRCIPADRLLNALKESIGDHTNTSDQLSANSKIPALQHLPPDIDLCLLVQHLAKKRKVLNSAGVQYRIAFACDRLKSWPLESAPHYISRDLQDKLRDVADRLPQAIVITPNFIEIAQQYLLTRLANVPGNRGIRILERRKRRGILTEIRKVILRRRPTVAFLGSDGAGKSSVVSTLVKLHEGDTRSLVAKKLYRRSLTYQLVSGIAKRLFDIDRDQFDSFASVLVTLRAITASWFRTAFRSKRPTVILDRSVASFLIKDRKSDFPSLSSAAAWIEPLIPPVTSVLLALPHSELTYRKNEMSAPGHDTYQRLLFEQTLRQQPADVILLASLESVQATAAVAARLLWHSNLPCDAAQQISQDRKAAA